MNTLLICDPEPVAIEGFRSLMASTGGPRVVAAKTNLEDAAGAVEDFQPSILLLAKEFGAFAESDCVRRLRHDGRPAAVIVWGASMTEREVLELLQAGVSGVVSKKASLREITDCIRTVASGGTWVECGQVIS